LEALKPLKKQLYSVEIETGNIGGPIKTINMKGNKTTYQVTQTTPLANTTAQAKAIAEEIERFRKRIFRF
jgi:hypothetical protein